jgi:predicted aldo/keto reductase-like oxidoreductase
MEYRIFGRTGLKVSRMGFGGIPIQRVEQAEADEIIARALQVGVNFFDTARGYTDSEEKLGLALSGNRHNVILASKSPQRKAAAFRQDLQTCLRLLKTDYIDLYQLHNISTKEAWEEATAEDGALKELERARKEGLVRFIGVSSHSNEMLLEMLGTELFDTIQFPFNPVEQQFIPSLERAMSLNLGTIAMKPLAGGSYERADLALRYIAQSAVHTTIPGVDSVEQVIKNAMAMSAGPLGEDEQSLLEAEIRTLGGAFCRRCDYCMPCPASIHISFVFILEGYVSRYGLKTWARERYAGLSAHGSDCVDCGACESRCPYNLPIREKLRNAHKALK